MDGWIVCLIDWMIVLSMVILSSVLWKYVEGSLDEWVWVMCVQHHFQKYSNCIVAFSFIDAGNRNTRRMPTTYRKTPTNLIISSIHHQRGIELTSVFVIGWFVVPVTNKNNDLYRLPSEIGMSVLGRLVSARVVVFYYLRFYSYWCC